MNSTMFFVKLFILLTINFTFGEQIKLTSVIQTDKGPIQGKILTTVLKSKKYAQFLGIPYAKPPHGTLRFQPPVVNDKWTDILNATVERNICTQYVSQSKSVVGSEDCLFLNVFTPHTEFNHSISKPVIVWIYGGSYNTGHSNPSFYGPDFIIEEDVIVVSFNYRTGPLGFLNLNHDKATGNAGLKDQTMALKWIQRNIAKFGGNPKNVTLLGQSAGATSVDLHVLSDLSKGLFQQTISMSGSTLCFYWGFQTSKEAEQQAFRLGTKLGMSTLNKDILLETLLNSSAVDIIAAATSLAFMPFRPTLENTDVAKNQDKFLTTCSVKKYHTGNYTRGPHIMGFTSDETLYFAGVLPALIGEALKSFDDAYPTSNIKFLEDLRAFATKKTSDLSGGEIYELIKKTTDLFYVLGIDSKQQLLSLHNKDSIYSYRFSFNSNYSLHKTMGIPLEGVGHADDLPYILYIPIAGLPLNQPDIAKTRNRMVKLFTNFAKYGNPTPNGVDDELLKITWTESGVEGLHLEINTNLTMKSRPVDATVKELQKAGLGAPSITNEC